MRVVSLGSKVEMRQLMRAAAMAASLVPINASADGARDWLNVPVDMNFIYLYYTYNKGESSIDTSLPITGASTEASVPVVRYARSFDVGGKIGGVQLIVPYAFTEFELDGTRINRSVDGIGDIQAVVIANLLGAPALSREEFARWSPETYLTASVAVKAPTGRYDPNRLVNIGANRWAFKPQLSYGIPLQPDEWLTFNGNIEFFTDNDRYRGVSTLSQNPLATVEAHYSRNLTRALWLSADAYYSYGGETSVNSIGRDDTQSTLKLGVSGSLNLTPVDAIAVSATHSVWKRDYTPDTFTLAINYNHAW